jgi:hypothetical protein
MVAERGRTATEKAEIRQKCEIEVLVQENVSVFSQEPLLKIGRPLGAYNRFKIAVRFQCYFDTRFRVRVHVIDCLNVDDKLSVDPEKFCRVENFFQLI